MRLRVQGEYKSFFTNSYKTIRLTSAKPITPELLDVAINNKCLANCPYCYTSALKSGRNFDNITNKAIEIWGKMPLNDRPFQIAIGGAGEPTLHPDFIPFIKEVRNLGIIPNYTTNGMHLSEDILSATEDICGGVALSWHPHIEKVFHESLNRLSKINTKLNVHVILGDKKSLEDLKFLYSTYKDIFDYFVILPYQAVGRAKNIEVNETWDNCFDWVSKEEPTKFAFGALFYEYIKEKNISLEMSIYNPDVYSGYVILDDFNFNKIFKSSYDAYIISD